MKIIDMHSHWGTKRGYPLQTAAELKQQRATWNSDPNYMTEAEMAQYFRDNNVRAVLDLGFSKFLPLEQMQSLHDYSASPLSAPIVTLFLVTGFTLIPAWAPPASRSCAAASTAASGFVGYAAIRSGKSPPASDPSYDPFYKLCMEAGVPVLIFVGTTGLGAGLPGGGGVILDNCHPRHLDWVAARIIPN